MLESYAVGVKFELVSNVASVLGKTIEEVELFDAAVKRGTESLALMSKGLGAFRGSAREVKSLAEALSKLDGSRFSSAATEGVNRLEQATARAKTETEALNRARQASTSRERAARSDTPPGQSAGLHGSGDDYANAAAENASRDRAYASSRALAEHENAAHTARAAAAARQSASRFDNDYAAAMRENSNMDRIAKEAGAAAAKRFQEDYALGMRENADRDASARAAGSSARASARAHATASHDLLGVGMGAGLAGSEIMSGVHYTVTPAIDMARTADVMAADTRLTPEQLQSAIQAAKDTTRAAPGSTEGENLAAILDLKNIFGDIEEAKKLLPEFARMTTLFEVMDKKSGGTGDQAYAAGKALEIMGGVTEEHEDASGHTVRSIDPGLGMQRLKAMERVAVAENMRVMPSDYLGMAKQARVAGMTLSDEYIYEKLPSMIAVMGGPRVGTALMSMAQVFEGGKLEAKSMHALQDIGLAGPEGIRHEGGRVDRHGRRVGGKDVVHSDAIFEGSLMMKDPQVWLADAQKQMEAHGIHGTADQIKALMRASQRSTIAGFFADMLKDMPTILKGQENVRATRPDMAEHMAAVDPAAKVRQFEAALTNLATELGSAGMGDAMKVLDAATAGLNKLGDWARNNPGMARAAFDVASGLGALATGLGALSAAVFAFGPAIALLKSLPGAAPAASAVPAAATAASAAPAALSNLAIPGALLYMGLKGAYDASMDPDFASKERAREGAAAKASAAAVRSVPQSSNFTPGDGFTVDGRPIQLQGTLNVDGKKLGTFTAQTMANGLSGPNGGTTGPDVRTGLQGAMTAN